MTPLFQAIFACGLASARYARLRSTTRPSIPNLQKRIYTNLLLHIAFMIDDVKGIREKLITAGATLVGDISITSRGAEIAMLRDPWGVAIQFVKRAEPMLRD